MDRLPDWKPRLIAHVVKSASRPLEPGVHDCAMFAADAVLALTGEDHVGEFRGRYRTLRGGLRMLRRSGYADHVALAAGILPERPHAMARPGDLAVVIEQDQRILAVVQGEHLYAVTPEGLGLQPLSHASVILGVG